MNPFQLSLLPDSCSPLDQTITKIRGSGVRHNNYVRFARTVAASAIGQRAGSLILCAALTDYDAAEICADIKQLIQETSEKAGTKTTGLCLVETPHALRAREMKSALVEAYHNAGELFCAQKTGKPPYNLTGAPSYLGENSCQRIATLIKYREPQFYMFKNVQLLQRIDSTPSDALEFVRMLAYIATASERTHILVGNAQTVLKWLGTKEIAEFAIPVVLEPYEFSPGDDRNHFLSLLAGYDQAVPWKDGAQLVPHAEYVHRIVRGSPHRLRKWLLNAVCNARALAQVELTWDCFTRAEPTGAEKTQATLEYEAIRKFLGKPFTPTPPPPTEAPKDESKPGTRKLGRDPYAA